MTVAVLDTSALLAMILGEPGGERVADVLRESAMTSVNYAEAATHFSRAGSSEDDIRFVLDIPVQWIDFDRELAFDAAMLLPKTQRAGLSLGDRACLALARRLQVKAITADRIWAKVASEAGVEIELIR